MKILKMKPVDSTFFREGSTFDVGSSKVITSRNVPYSSTFFGSIFSGILVQNPLFQKEFFKFERYDHEKILKIGNVFIYDEENDITYLPAPKDIFVNNNKYKCGIFKEFVDGEQSNKLKTYLDIPEGYGWDRVEEGYLAIHEFYNRYRNDSLNPVNLKSSSDIFKKTIKTGIALDSKKMVVMDEMIYSIEQTEFCDSNDYKWSFLVEYEIDFNYIKSVYGISNLVVANNGYLKLGGEGKVCKYVETENKDIDELYLAENRIDLSNNNLVKIIMTSDSYFEENIENVFSDDFELIGIANDKPIYIGGYDMKKNNSHGVIRSSYRGYSCGTILYLKINLRASHEEIKESLDRCMNCNSSKGFNKYLIIGEDKNGE